MNIPTATYRIQFRNGMTFDRAAELVPYLNSLGISHLYASPIFTATAGSTHGYDIVDCNEIEPAIGGRQSFDRMVQALKQAGLGLILDIVPNHMAASIENPWWRDVVEHGENSQYARHFDIDWSQKLTLPFLGDTFENAVEAGEISVEPDPRDGRPAFRYHDAFYPLNPESYDRADFGIVTDARSIIDLHHKQTYRLMSWREAPRDLSYRRFFEITGLAGVRVEDSQVFDETHRLILELVRSGAVDGLRVDHVDGLADPKGYLERLRQEAGPDCYIVVEKILGDGEKLPAEWPISGTTGYEFIDAISDVLVDSEKLDELREAYDSVVGHTVDMEDELRSAKLLMANKNFAGEVARLVQLAEQIGHVEGKDLWPDGGLETVLKALLITFPVYRTYGTAQGLPPEDQERLTFVVSEVKRRCDGTPHRELGFLASIILGEVIGPAIDLAATFRTRFQQLTGPLMAKSVEDTLFFRHHLALALNEVGANPLRRKFSIERFHREMAMRFQRQPDALSTTSTHDTKRGEDARARLYAITEAPRVWSDAVIRWREMNKGQIERLDDGPAPEPAVEWMLYQTLAGVWPPKLRIDDGDALMALEHRFVEFVEKALREAKQRTNWGDGNDAYEKAVIAYARHLVSPESIEFLADFTETIRPFIHAGLLNGISQTIVKLTAPGVPDIYQGSEGLDLSLVDPDNRREPDFEALRKRTDPTLDLTEGLQSGALKQHLITTLLRLRKDSSKLFREGKYLPLKVTGRGRDNAVAYARIDGLDAVIVIVPRLSLATGVQNGSHLLERCVALPGILQDRGLVDVFTKQAIRSDGELQLSDLGRPYHVLKTL